MAPLEHLAGAARTMAARARLMAGAGLPLGELTHVLADAYGGRPAIDAESDTPALPRRLRTYAALDEDVARLAAAYQAASLGPAQVVAVLCANRIDVLLHVLAVARIGAVPLPLNARLRPEEQAAAVSAAGAKAIVADADAVAPLAALEGMRPLRVLWTGAGGPAPDGAFDLAAWLDAHPDQRAGPVSQDAEAAAILLCTSGTTGRPKVARLTGRGLLGALGRSHALPVGLQRWVRAGRDAVLVALPLTHVMGLGTMVGSLCAGVKVIHLEKFDAARVLDRIERDQPNVFVGVPTMYADLEEAGAAARNLSSIELWVSAADAMPPDRARRFQQYGALVRPGGVRLGTAAFADVYGMVELAGPAAVRFYPPAPRGRELPAIGMVLPGFSARVIGTDGEPRRIGGTGELQLKGKAVFAGYEGSSGVPGDGWFSTGDVARLGPFGTFAFVGRSADRIKVGGFSVFPAEVEEELRGFAGVEELAVVGVPEERLGEIPVALVVARHGFDAEEFLQWAAARVAPYRRPRRAFAVEKLPRGKNAKLDRRSARELARGLAGR
ncbi:MAG TPA: class I adenylate-forming enzyme family protein [Myxococcales bacterium]